MDSLWRNPYHLLKPGRTSHFNRISALRPSRLRAVLQGDAFLLGVAIHPVLAEAAKDAIPGALVGWFWTRASQLGATAALALLEDFALSARKNGIFSVVVRAPGASTGRSVSSSQHHQICEQGTS